MLVKGTPGDWLGFIGVRSYSATTEAPELTAKVAERLDLYCGSNDSQRFTKHEEFG